MKFFWLFSEVKRKCKWNIVSNVTFDICIRGQISLAPRQELKKSGHECKCVKRPGENVLQVYYT